ncbi:hypothetical protein IAD21_03862 [Abditibacteriota bacterium]|nr:hypothetical protein IAD21_03862 [Abditibacteriota bacterium]
MPLALRRFQEIREVALPKAAVWSVLSHTDRINRNIGLPPVSYGDLKTGEGGDFRPAKAKMLGIPLEWREYPFSWESEGRYSVVRVYERGPIARFEAGTELEENGPNSTRITFFADIIPRGLTGRALVPIVARQSLRKTVELSNRLLAAPGSPFAIQAPAPRKTAVDEALLRRLCIELGRHPLEARVVTALEALLREGGDDEVTGLRPYEWARRVGINRNEALRACLHAVKVGLLNQRWAMMCPNCRVAKREVTTLSEVESQVHCDLCGVNYALNFDRYVELRFAVQPAVRRAQNNIYCLGGPFRAPHILLQRQLLPGQKTFIPRLLKTDEMRLRVLKWNNSIDIAPENAAPTEVAWDGSQWSHLSARGAFEAHNASQEPIIIALEKQVWDPDAVTAAQVTAMQEFRDLFSGEVLAPGREMAVENVTLFFSDLSNSTALYENIGDAPAFAHVGRHFDFLQGVIGREGGAVVKTMGDAVMAVFNTPADAVRASLALQRGFPAVAQKEGTSSIALKIGLHFGPALAVNSNDRLDYFGRTVNIAARVSAQAQGGEMVFTEQLWRHPEVRATVFESEAHYSMFCTKLRGVEEDFSLIRVKF